MTSFDKQKALIWSDFVLGTEDDSITVDVTAPQPLKAEGIQIEMNIEIHCFTIY